MSFSLDRRTIRTAICVIAISFAAGDAFKDVRDYRRAGTHPAPMTVADASAASAVSPFVRRWIRLTEPLQLDCEHALLDSGDGDSGAATVILAFDQQRQHSFLVQYKGNLHCDEARALPLEGMLVEPSTKFWTTHGMSVPATPFPMIQLEVGVDPSGLLQEAEVLSGVTAICMGLLWYMWIYRRSPEQKKSNETPFAKAARVP